MLPITQLVQFRRGREEPVAPPSSHLQGLWVSPRPIPAELHEAAAGRAWGEQSHMGFWKFCCSLFTY